MSSLQTPTAQNQSIINALGLESLGMGLIGSGISAGAEYEKGQAEKAADYYNAQVTLEEMQEKMSESEQKFSELMGRQRSLYGKAGVDVQSGSPIMVLSDTAMREAQEQQRIQYAGESQAAMERYAGQMAAWGGTMSAMDTFLTGIGKTSLGLAQFMAA